jgi:hypothetical protein
MLPQILHHSYKPHIINRYIKNAIRVSRINPMAYTVKNKIINHSLIGLRNPLPILPNCLNSFGSLVSKDNLSTALGRCWLRKVARWPRVYMNNHDVLHFCTRLSPSWLIKREAICFPSLFILTV